MGRRVLRRHIWGYTACMICPPKRTPCVIVRLASDRVHYKPSQYSFRRNGGTHFVICSNNLYKTKKRRDEGQRIRYVFSVLLSALLLTLSYLITYRMSLYRLQASFNHFHFVSYTANITCILSASFIVNTCLALLNR